MEKLKRVALLLIAITAGLFLTGTLLAWIYKDKVRNLVVESLNNNLKAEIEVEEISFSFFGIFLTLRWHSKMFAPKNLADLKLQELF
jgi:hypothetical protein